MSDPLEPEIRKQDGAGRLRRFLFVTTAARFVAAILGAFLLPVAAASGQVVERRVLIVAPDDDDERVMLAREAVAFWNRTLSDLAEVVKRTYRFTLEHAQKHPSVVLEDVSVDTVGGPVYRVRARVANRGEFPTHVSNKGRTLRRLRPVRVEFHAARGVELLSAEGHTEVGHLAGVTGSRTLEWFVSAPKPGKGLCEIRVLGGTGGNASVKVGV